MPSSAPTATTNEDRCLRAGVGASGFNANEIPGRKVRSRQCIALWANTKMARQGDRRFDYSPVITPPFQASLSKLSVCVVIEQDQAQAEV